jgi:hypothetical protein
MIFDDFNNILEQCIINIINEQKQCIFFNEEEFHLKLYLELNEYLKIKYPLKNIHTVVECYDILFYIDNNINKNNIKNNRLKKSNKIDIVSIIENKYYLIEIKYSAYKNSSKFWNYTAGANKYDVLNQYKRDIIKLKNIINDTNNVNIANAYCILLITNNLENELKIKEIDEKLNWNKSKLLEQYYSFCIKCL